MWSHLATREAGQLCVAYNFKTEGEGDMGYVGPPASSHKRDTGATRHWKENLVRVTQKRKQKGASTFYFLLPCGLPLAPPYRQSLKGPQLSMQ
jgi:hypothetical protein